MKVFNQIIRVIEITFQIVLIVAIFIGLNTFFTNLNSNVSSVESAMQASQLYNEATATLLGVIIVILFFIFLKIPSLNSLHLLQQRVKASEETVGMMSEYIKKVNELLEKSIPFQKNDFDMPNSSTSNPQIPQSKVEKSSVAFKMVCKKCNSPMLIRTATKGEYEGKQFYVCSNYPKCNEVIRID